MNATSQRPDSNRDPEQLERSAERIRADLDRTLDALERKLSPSQLLDRSLAYLRDHGGDLAVAVGDSVRRNPVPILVTVAGLGWLIATAVRSRAPIDVTPIDDTEIDDTLDDETPESSYADPHTLRSRFDNRVAAARARTRQAQYRAVSAVEERPLLFGGLAVALGALLGAIVPSTEYEDKFVGQVRDRAVERAKQMGERQYQNLRSRFENPDLEVSGQAH
jgi:hypothetical protein